MWREVVSRAGVPVGHRAPHPQPVGRVLAPQDRPRACDAPPYRGRALMHVAPLIRRKLTRREEWTLLLACIALLPLAVLVLVARVRR